MKTNQVMRNLAIALAVALSSSSMTLSADSDVVFYESFNGLSGQGGNDGYFDNDEAAGVEVGAEDLLSAELLDNKEGWGDFVKVAICDKCVRIATKKNNGEITTPAFAATGTATLTFNAAAQLEDVTTLYVEVVGEGKLTYGDTTDKKIAINLPATVAGETTLANENYTLGLTDVTGDISIKFSTISTSTSKQRAYIDEIKVVNGTSSVAANIYDEKQTNEAFDLLGRRVAPTSRGFLIINGKKVIR